MNAIIAFARSSVGQAMIAKAVRWSATMAAAAATYWVTQLLTKYGVSASDIGIDTKEISGAVFALVMGAGSLVYSLLDVQKVDAKITAAYIGGVKDTANATANQTGLPAQISAAKIASDPVVLGQRIDNALADVPSTKAAVIANVVATGSSAAKS